ncbi:MAG: ribosome rescue GTPase HflX [Gammaproteobacteria bacterium]
MRSPSPSPERAIIAHIVHKGADTDQDLQEFRELASSAGALVVSIVTGSRNNPDARSFIGAGKLQELNLAVRSTGVEIVLFNHELTPAQQRNLESALGCRVVDRTGVILDIFAQRARSFEGKLQVELAQLRYHSTRLVRGWSHLERQKGGIGLRGPGETQLETDRRLIARRMEQIGIRLERVRHQRGRQRLSRRKAATRVVSLVGYTNAGKSTLFNLLTGADEYVADQPFATLDLKLRKVEIGGTGLLVLSDTVGFIRRLPHDLVAAFRATLEEAREAQLLLHVIDAGADDRLQRAEQVSQVLEQIGATSQPRIEVYNKIDRIARMRPKLETQGAVPRVWLSALTGEGVDLLKRAMAEQLGRNNIRRWLRLSGAASRLRARLYAAGMVLQEEIAQDGAWLLDVEGSRPQLTNITRESGVSFYPHNGANALGSAHRIVQQ